MGKMMTRLMLSCKKATGLIDKRLVISLSFREKIQLRLHKSICDACTTYDKQSKKIDELLHRYIHDSSGKHPTPIQNEELKERIVKKLL